MKTAVATVMAAILLASASFAHAAETQDYTALPQPTSASAPDEDPGRLSAGLQQMVEIAAVLSSAGQLTWEHLVRISRILTKYMK